MPGSGLAEVGAVVGGGQVQRPPSRRRRVLELFTTPKHCCFRSRSPKFGDLGERAPQPTLHVQLERWCAACQNLEILPLERDGEEADRAPEHPLSRRAGGPGAFCRRANCASPPLRELRTPTPVGGNHRRDKLERSVCRRSAPVVRREPSSPRLLHEGTPKHTGQCLNTGSVFGFILGLS